MKSNLSNLNIKLPLFSLFLTTVLVFGFQNCSQVKFSDKNYSELDKNGIQNFKVNEDSVLDAQPKTFSFISGKSSVFTISRQTTHGKITSFNPRTGQFTYKPAEKYFGDDFFQYIENESGVSAPHIMGISIQVIRAAHLPTIMTDSVGFEMNTVEIPFPVVVTDYHDPLPQAILSLNLTIRQATTAHGIIKQIDKNRFSYTPAPNFRGNDQIELIAINSNGETSKKNLILTVGNPFHGLEPSMAVRGIGCVACHLNTTSKVIADFGAGSDYFFGKNAPDGSQFSAPHSFYSDHGANGLQTASMTEILIPNIQLPFSPGSVPLSMSTAQKQATTLADYVTAVRGNATVTVKNNIFIGAPSAVTLASRTGIGSAPFVFLKNQDSSPGLSGLENKGSYFQASLLTCDGDLTINGSLFLKDLTLKTNDGCRIYATGAIFVNGEITYSQLTAGPTNNANLQLVSSTWINLGVGITHCELDPNYPIAVPNSWYRTWPREAIDPVTNAQSPLYHRTLIYPAPTRSGTLNGATMRTVVQGITGFQDASCRTPTAGAFPREVHYERLLLNAPRIDSRYTGQFTGVIIAEAILMSLSNFTFTYDSVFNRVPVLPLLKPSDFLIVQ